MNQEDEDKLHVTVINYVSKIVRNNYLKTEEEKAEWDKTSFSDREAVIGGMLEAEEEYMKDPDFHSDIEKGMRDAILMTLLGIPHRCEPEDVKKFYELLEKYGPSIQNYLAEYETDFDAIS